jgi:hypothetical protein
MPRWRSVSWSTRYDIEFEAEGAALTDFLNQRDRNYWIGMISYT